MRRREKIYKELFLKNTKRANDMMIKILMGFLLICAVLCLVAYNGLLKADHMYILTWDILTMMLIIPIYFLRKIKISEEVLKYYIVVIVLISIGYGACDGSIAIRAVYILPAIVSLAYVDKRFTYLVSFLSYAVVVVSLVFASEYQVDNIYTNYDRAEWFIANSIGYTIEFLILSFGIHVAITRIDDIMNALGEQNERVFNMQNDVIAAFSGLVESRDTHTGEHVKRTGNTVKLIMDSMFENDIYKGKLDKKNARLIQMAAPLHDIGKIKIPDSILCKPARLTEEEFSKMKYHTSEGMDIINRYLDGMEEDAFINKAREIVLSHHERWDGEGYPNRLKEEEIPLSARIMAVADVFDALVSKRCYKEAIPFEEAYEIIIEGSGKQFDPEIVKALTLKKEELRKLYEESVDKKSEDEPKDDVVKSKKKIKEDSLNSGLEEDFDDDDN